MIDFQAATSADLEKHKDHFPSGSDLTLQALKGHLLVEELLREVFLLQLTHPDALKGSRGASFDCHQIICLTEAMTLHSDNEPWLWVAAKKLNNLRNDLAHQLSPKALGDKVSDLVRYATKEYPYIRTDAKELEIPEGHEFELVVMSMCVCLSSLKAVLVARRQRHGA